MDRLPIQSLVTSHLSLPTSRLGFARPLGNAVKSLPSLDYVTVRLRAGALEGLGYAFTPGHGPRTIRACIEETLRPVALGADALAPRDLWEAMRQRLRHVGPQGVASFAMAAVDIACWDLCAQAHGLPLHRLLGHGGRALPVYATVGFLSLTEDELRQQTEKALDRGVSGVKLMVGHADPDVDARRVRLVADLAGSARRVMIDANCAFRTLPEALDRMAALRDFPVYWIEEPLQPDQVEDLSAFRARAPFRTASGESVYLRQGLRRLIEARAVDIVQPDLYRMGGISECLCAFALIESHDLLLAPHHLPELMAPLLGGWSSALSVEYLPYFVEGVFERAPVIQGGMIRPLEVPGHGLRFHPEALRAAVD